jgi:hypothetical protein
MSDAWVAADAAMTKVALSPGVGKNSRTVTAAPAAAHAFGNILIARDNIRTSTQQQRHRAVPARSAMRGWPPTCSVPEVALSPGVGKNSRTVTAAPAAAHAFGNILIARDNIRTLTQQQHHRAVPARSAMRGWPPTRP